MMLGMSMGKGWGLQGSDSWGGAVRLFQSLGRGWVGYRFVFLLEIVVEIVVTLSFEEFTNEK